MRMLADRSGLRSWGRHAPRLAHGRGVTPTGSVTAEMTVAAPRDGYQRPWRSRASTPQAGGSGRSRERAASGPGLPGPVRAGRAGGRVDRPARSARRTGAKPIRSTPSAPRGSVGPRAPRPASSTGRARSPARPVGRPRGRRPRPPPGQRPSEGLIIKCPSSSPAAPPAHHRTTCSPAAHGYGAPATTRGSTGDAHRASGRSPGARAGAGGRARSALATSGRRARAISTDRTRRRREHRRATPQRLVAPGPLPLRSRLRGPPGVAPIPASSGQVDRHRLNRSATATQPRPAHDRVLPPRATTPKPSTTPADDSRRKTPRETIRCLNATSPAASTASSIPHGCPRQLRPH